MKITVPRWLPALLAACSFLPASVASAADDSYAVVALFGNSLSVVFYQPTTGTSLDKNNRQSFPLTDGHYDGLAAQVSATAIHDALPNARIETLSLPDDTPARILDAPMSSVIEAVKGTLKQPDTHYLVVIGKYRGDAHLRMAHGSTGSGKLEGIGFYVDTQLRMKRTSTGESGRGFVAPYAYLTISLIDLRTGELVRSEAVTESTTRANVGPSTTLDPWDALTAEDKARLLDAMVRKALLQAVPRVVAPA